MCAASPLVLSRFLRDQGKSEYAHSLVFGRLSLAISSLRGLGTVYRYFYSNRIIDTGTKVMERIVGMAHPIIPHYVRSLHISSTSRCVLVTATPGVAC